MSVRSPRKALAAKVVIFAVALAAMVVFAGLALAKTNPVTRTFSNATSIAIPEIGPATPYPSTIEVTGFDTGCTLTDINATLHDFSHTFANDVSILLVGPHRQNVVLVGEAGFGIEVSNVTLTLDDEAAKPLPQFDPLTSGVYRPTNYDPDRVFASPAPSGPYGTALSVFDGTNPNGTYSLYIEDFQDQDAGSLAGGFSLEIMAACTVAPPPLPPPPQPAVTQDGEQESESGEVDQDFEVS